MSIASSPHALETNPISAPPASRVWLVRSPAEAAAAPKRTRFGWVKLALLADLLLLALVTCVYVRDNFSPVVPGRVYRSAELSRASLEKYVARFRIRSVVNLRGSNPDKAWYHRENATLAERGIRLYDIRLSSVVVPTPTQVRELIWLFDACPRPVLMHCESGCDRTSMAAAIWVLLQEGCTVADARGQLGLAHWQLPWRQSARQFQDWVNAYETWLARERLIHAPAHFRRWVHEEYRMGPLIPGS
jgi:hypothetical protein